MAAHRFPAAFRQFLDQHNGARLVRPTLSVGGREVMIERFLPVVADPSVDADGWADIAVVATQLDARLALSEDSLGFDCVPFAALFGGDFLVLEFADAATEPRVAHWDHELSEEMAPALTPVAPDFAAFLAMLD